MTSPRNKMEHIIIIGPGRLSFLHYKVTHQCIKKKEFRDDNWPSGWDIVRRSDENGIWMNKNASRQRIMNDKFDIFGCKNDLTQSTRLLRPPVCQPMPMWMNEHSATPQRSHYLWHSIRKCLSVEIQRTLNVNLPGERVLRPTVIPSAASTPTSDAPNYIRSSREMLLFNMWIANDIFARNCRISKCFTAPHWWRRCQSWWHECKYPQTRERNGIIEWCRQSRQNMRTPFAVIIFWVCVCVCVLCVVVSGWRARFSVYPSARPNFIWCDGRFVTLKNNIISFCLACATHTRACTIFDGVYSTSTHLLMVYSFAKGNRKLLQVELVCCSSAAAAAFNNNHNFPCTHIGWLMLSDGTVTHWL